MRSSEGAVEDLVFLDVWEEAVPVGEPFVVLEELLAALRGSELHEDPRLRPARVETLFYEGLEDPVMNMLYIRRRTVPVQRGHKDLTRIYLFWILELPIHLEGLFNSLSQLGRLEGVWP